MRGAADKIQDRMIGNNTSNQTCDGANSGQRRENSKLGSMLVAPASFLDASRMELFDSSVAVCVAETGSFHRAAKVLSIGQPTATRDENANDRFAVGLANACCARPL